MKTTNDAALIYQDALIIDNQLAFEVAMPLSFEEKWTIVERYAKAGFSALTLSLVNDEATPEITLTYVAKFLHYISQHTDKYILAYTASDILHAKKEHKLALRLMFQGTSPIGKDLNMIGLYYQLGIRSMVLAYNIKNVVGDGVVEINDGGLSHFGRQVVIEMNRVGMLIDLSHTGHRTAMEALALSTSPVISSHAGAYAINPHIRTIKDEQIKAIARSGGVVGINGLGLLLGTDAALPEKFVDHIDYIAELVGVEHVAIGLDFLYFADQFEAFMKHQGVSHPQAYAKKVRGVGAMLAPEQLLDVVKVLLQRGYSKQAIKGIVGENTLRVIYASEARR